MPEAGTPVRAPAPAGATADVRRAPQTGMPPASDDEGGKGGGPGALIEEYAPWSYAVLAGVGIAIVWFLFVRGRGGGSRTSGGVLPSGQVSTGQAGDATAAAVQSLQQRIAEEKAERQKSEQQLLATVQGWIDNLSKGFTQALGQVSDQVRELGKTVQTGFQQEAKARAEMESRWDKQLQDMLSGVTKSINDVTSSVATLGQSVQSLTGTVESLSGSVQSLSETVQTQQQSISSLQQQLATLADSVSKGGKTTGSNAKQTTSAASKTYVTPSGPVTYDPATGVGVRNGVAVVSEETPHTQSGRYGRDPGSGQVVDIPTGTQVGTREHSIATGLIPASPEWYEAIRAAGLIK